MKGYCQLVLVVCWCFSVDRAVLTDEVVYGVQDFSDVPFEADGATLPHWSLARVEDTPGTPRHPRDRFLGQFGCPSEPGACDGVSLRLDALPVHTRVRISFDLYVIRTWDGNDPQGSFGPDVWTLDVQGGPRLMATTFSNVHFVRAGDLVSKRQSFPDPFPDGDHVFQTGAVEAGSLGYTAEVFDVGILPMDSVYRLQFEFAHSDDSVEFVFASPRRQPKVDESWGLDNVEVRVDGPFFQRGHVNDDELVDLSDAIAILGCLFLGTPCPSCSDAADINDDGRLNIGDPIFLLQHEYLGGAAPESPFVECGVDPTTDALDCASPRSCE